jgi:DNA-binding beta-propeller fold protein YncE
MRFAAFVIGVSMLSIGPALAAGKAKVPAHATVTIAIPGGESGIGFDDLGYSRTLGKLLVPAGRTGKLVLVDPATGKVVSIPGFSTREDFSGGHDDGITSVAEGAGLLFVTDRTSQQLSIVDPATQTIVAQSSLGASPDYVRWLESARELWVTEPDSERIEVYRLETGTPPHAVRVATIEVPEGPESLILDPKRGRAYTHLSSRTAAIDLRSRAIAATWSNGCAGATGIALDSRRGFLFVACEEGGVKVLDAATGKRLGSVKLGGGIDIISYNADLGHLYAPSAETKSLAILGVSPKGALSLLGTFPGTADSHCVAAGGKVYVADPERGRLVVVTDPYPASPR